MRPPFPSGDSFVAAGLDFAFDYRRMAAEILACREYFSPSPPYQQHIDDGLSGRIPFMSESSDNYRRIDTMGPGGVVERELRPVQAFYLRDSRYGDVRRVSTFRVTKTLAHDTWDWRGELADRIPYVMHCIESLPYRRLGLVRAFVCENSFMPTHRDSDAQYEKSRALGISLTPATGGVSMLAWDDERRAVEEVPGHCFLFNDAKWHGVPMTDGPRVTLRIFGEIDYWRLCERFAPSDR